jgi:hypothetical protein
MVVGSVMRQRLACFGHAKWSSPSCPRTGWCTTFHAIASGYYMLRLPTFRDQDATRGLIQLVGREECSARTVCWRFPVWTSSAVSDIQARHNGVDLSKWGDPESVKSPAVARRGPTQWSLPAGIWYMHYQRIHNCQFQSACSKPDTCCQLERHITAIWVFSPKGHLLACDPDRQSRAELRL